MKNLWILTEEKPKRSVVIEILKKYSIEYSRRIEVDSKGIIIAPIFEEKKYYLERTFLFYLYMIPHLAEK